MNSVLLSEKIEASSFTKNDIAESLGLTRQGLYNKLTGIREFKGSEIKKLIKMLHLSEQEQHDIFFADDVGTFANANTAKQT